MELVLQLVTPDSTDCGVSSNNHNRLCIHKKWVAASGETRIVLPVSHVAILKGLQENADRSKVVQGLRDPSPLMLTRRGNHG